MLPAMQDTMVLPPAADKKPLPLVPLLVVALLVAVGAAGFFAYRTGDGGDALAAANANASQAQAELAQAQARIRALERELAAQKTELAAALRTLPVDVSFQVVDGALVASFENRSTTALDLVVEPRRARTGEYGRLELSLPAEGRGQLSEKQGWTFRSGDTLTVTAGDFRPVSLAVP
jgi:flagellar basal body-associated protein FliL